MVRALILWVALSAGAAHAATFVVDDTGTSPDGSPGDCVCSSVACGTGHCTLTAAIQEANGCPGLDTILLPEPLTVPNAQALSYVIYDSLPLITDDVNIVGVLSYGSLTPCLALSDAPSVFACRDAVEVEIKSRSGSGLTRAFSIGTGANVHLSSAHVLDSRGSNHALAVGGCLSTLGNLWLSNYHTEGCTNDATQHDLCDGTNAGMGADIYNGGILTVDQGSLFDTAHSNWGSSLFNAQGAAATITDSMFLNSHCDGLDQDSSGEGDTAGGGGCVANFGSFTANRTTFNYCRNRLGIGGGAILNGSDPKCLAYSAAQDTGLCGGCFLGLGGAVSLTNVTMTDNRARRSSGGAITSWGGAISMTLTGIAHTQSYGHSCSNELSRPQIDPRCDSAICLHDGATLTVDNSFIGHHNMSQPSAGYPLIYTGRGDDCAYLGGGHMDVGTTGDHGPCLPAGSDGNGHVCPLDGLIWWSDLPPGSVTSINTSGHLSLSELPTDLGPPISPITGYVPVPSACDPDPYSPPVGCSACGASPCLTDSTSVAPTGYLLIGANDYNVDCGCAGPPRGCGRISNAPTLILSNLSPAATSAYINAGPATCGESVDGRGCTRPIQHCDLGAYEEQTPIPSTPTSTPTLTPTRTRTPTPTRTPTVTP